MREGLSSTEMDLQPIISEINTLSNQPLKLSPGGSPNTNVLNSFNTEGLNFCINSP